MAKKVSLDKLVIGPTFDEMLNPEKIPARIRKKAKEMMKKDPMDTINLFNITWKDFDNKYRYFVVPKELTGVKANIAVLYAKDFPTGSHKVGPTYSVLIEKEIFGEVDPAVHTVVWPSTGNYGIGGAYVGCRMGFKGIVILPEEMSAERFSKIKSYGATVIATKGCESNVKEIYDKCWELRNSDPNIRIMNQFEEFGNYRFHYHVTGNSISNIAAELKKKKIGAGRISAFVSSMGSSGTIAAGDRLKQIYPECKIVGLEPIQCPTLYSNGYGGHDIQGIGDKHVTWVHNVKNMDAIMCTDDIESKRGLQLLVSKNGQKWLNKKLGIKVSDASFMSQIFGISGVCNLQGAIKTAKHYNMTEDDVVFTVCTDNIDRYHSVMKQMDKSHGAIDDYSARAVYEKVFEGVKLDYIKEGTVHNRDCWHNLKYYTWVEQQGKTVEELDAQKSQKYWEAEQQKIKAIDKKIMEFRKKKGLV